MIKFRYKLSDVLIANLANSSVGAFAFKNVVLAFWVSYAVKPVKIRTPMILTVNCSAELAKKMFTTLAIIIPIRPISKKLPQPLISFLVVYPYRLALAKVAAVIKNTCAILAAV